MAESLRDQLLKSGIVKKVQSERGREPKRPAGKKPPSGPTRERGASEIDLAKASPLRGHVAAPERNQAEREPAEQARLRRERQLRTPPIGTASCREHVGQDV